MASNLLNNKPYIEKDEKLENSKDLGESISSIPRPRVFRHLIARLAEMAGCMVPPTYHMDCLRASIFRETTINKIFCCFVRNHLLFY